MLAQHYAEDSLALFLVNYHVDADESDSVVMQEATVVDVDVGVAVHLLA